MMKHTLILNIYVDDLTLAGGTKEMQQEFLTELQQRVKVEPEEFISETGNKDPRKNTCDSKDLQTSFNDL